MGSHTIGANGEWPLSGMVTATVECNDVFVRALKASKSSSKGN